MFVFARPAFLSSRKALLTAGITRSKLATQSQLSRNTHRANTETVPQIEIEQKATVQVMLRAEDSPVKGASGNRK